MPDDVVLMWPELDAIIHGVDLGTMVYGVVNYGTELWPLNLVCDFTMG